MDPNANLKEQLEIAQKFVECPQRLNTEVNHEHCRCAEDMERMGELVLALDGWLRSGGFLPAVWGKTRQSA